jgi:predicted CoA-substrate-specific enzyme activase
MTIVAGVDVGSVTAKTVLMDDRQNVLATHVVYQGIVNEEAAKRCFTEALAMAGLNRASIDFIVVTGYGRDLVGFADLTITEISCHADGAAFVLEGVRTVVDVGGQDSKVIGLDENGIVLNFRMNDRCAAGTGRFLEVMARALELDINEIGPLALSSTSPAKVSSTCTVFAESEIVSLMAQGVPKVDIVAGMHRAICRRLAGMVRGVGIRERVAMTGGVAQNAGVIGMLEKEIGTKIIVPEYPQVVGAIGAARFALREVGRLRAIDVSEIVSFEEMAHSRFPNFAPPACSDCAEDGD